MANKARVSLDISINKKDLDKLKSCSERLKSLTEQLNETIKEIESTKINIY